MATIDITPDMTMQEILQTVPSAQRALFQRYHIGGCSSCAFQPTDTLAKVCKDHNILDVNDVLRTIQNAKEADERMEVEPRQVHEWLEAGEEFSFIDVRSADEIALSSVAAAEPLDFAAQDKYMALPREQRMVFMCHSGVRSLDVAAYFAGHGFTKVHSVRGGILAWAEQVDPTLPRV